MADLNNSMTVQAVEQGVCTESNDDETDWYERERSMTDKGIDRLLTCPDGRAAIRINEDGMEAWGRISHENATWNQESDYDE